MGFRLAVSALVSGALVVLASVGTAESASALAATPDIVALSVPADTVDCETSPGAVITAHLTDAAGIRDGQLPVDGDTSAVTYLSIQGYLFAGELVSGSAQDGTWSFGPFCLFKPTGSWQVTLIHLVGLDGGKRDVVPSTRGFVTTFTTVGRYGAFSAIKPASNVDTTVRYGRTKTLTGNLAWYFNGPTPLAGVALQVWEKVPQTPTFPDGDETMLGSTTTRADGSWSFTWMPLHNSFRTYVTWPAGTNTAGIRYMSGVAWTQRTYVQVLVNATPPTSVPRGTIGLVQGNVLPNKAGRFVYLQRWSASGWGTVSSARIRTSSRFTLALTLQSAASTYYRVYKASDAQNTGLTTAPFVVRTV